METQMFRNLLQCAIARPDPGKIWGLVDPVFTLWLKSQFEEKV
jgi:hypothetical protein